jgi:hypothetical protein
MNQILTFLLSVKSLVSAGNIRNEMYLRQAQTDIHFNELTNKIKVVARGYDFYNIKIFCL